MRALLRSPIARIVFVLVSFAGLVAGAAIGEAIAVSASQEQATAGYDEVQQAIFDRFEPYGLGHVFVRISYFEGWNEYSGFDLAYLSPSDDACPLQINQVHDDTPQSVLRKLFGDEVRWPGPLAHLPSCLDAAEQIYLEQGLNAWKNSRVRRNSAGVITGGWDTSAPIFNRYGQQVGAATSASAVEAPVPGFAG